MGAEKLNSTISYKWIKNNESYEVFYTVNTRSYLLFSPLRVSAGGKYSCKGMIISPYLNEVVNIESINTINLKVQSKTDINLI